MKELQRAQLRELLGSANALIEIYFQGSKKPCIIRPEGNQLQLTGVPYKPPYTFSRKEHENFIEVGTKFRYGGGAELPTCIDRIVLVS